MVERERNLRLLSNELLTAAEGPVKAQESFKRWRPKARGPVALARRSDIPTADFCAQRRNNATHEATIRFLEGR